MRRIKRPQPGRDIGTTPDTIIVTGVITIAVIIITDTGAITGTIITIGTTSAITINTVTTTIAEL
jgi:hypothetical protein